MVDPPIGPARRTESQYAACGTGPGPSALVAPLAGGGTTDLAALAAVMSTASATLLAASTILANDVYAEFFSRGGDRVRLSRVFTLLVGVAVLVISLLVKDVVGGLRWPMIC